MGEFSPEVIAELRQLLVDIDGGQFVANSARWRLLDRMREHGPALLDAAEKAAEWSAKCDEVGIPHDPDTLVRHHRGNAGLAAAFDAQADIIEARADLARLHAVIQRLRAGWLPFHQVREVADSWCWGRPMEGEDFYLWSIGRVPLMSVVEPMTRDEVDAWVSTLHPFAPELAEARALPEMEDDRAER